MNDKFDFRTAELLVTAVEKAASTLDVQNGQMEQRFAKLHDSFRDSGYDEFTGDMRSANNSIQSVITQMHMVSKAISDYSLQLQQNI